VGIDTGLIRSGGPERLGGGCEAISAQDYPRLVASSIVLVGAVALIVIWGLVAFVGPGSIVFWERTADSWRSVATGLTGWGLVIIEAQYFIAVR